MFFYPKTHDICPRVQGTFIKGIASIPFTPYQSAASAVTLVGQTIFVGETANSLLVRLTNLFLTSPMLKVLILSTEKNIFSYFVFL